MLPLQLLRLRGFACWRSVQVILCAAFSSWWLLPSLLPIAERARAEAEEAERLAKMRERHSASNLAKLGSDAARVAAAAGAAPAALAAVAPGMTLEQVIREAQVGVRAGWVLGSSWVEALCSEACRGLCSCKIHSSHPIQSFAALQASRDPIWVHESLLPLWLIKAYEERVRQG